LLVTLFTLVVIAFLVTQIAASARRHLLIATHLRDAAQLEAAADGAVFETVFRVLSRQMRIGGAPLLLRGAPIRIVAWVTDEGGKIDLNVAPVQLLAGLATVCGADAATAARAAAAIFDWRSPNLPPTPNGAKAPQYAAAGLDYGPPNAKFSRPSELALVLGVSQVLYLCMLPHVTVYSGSIPAPELADPLTAGVIDDVYPERASIFLGSAYRPHVIRVIVDTSTERGARFTRTAIIRLPLNDGAKYHVLDWR
jgi:general secretion pathway protein K